MGKSFSILISAVFIVTLISSSPLSSVRTSALTPQQTHDFLYSIKVSPTFVKVQQGEFGTFDVQVARGSNAGQFLVHLSLIADSSQLKAGASFIPAQLSFEEGQTTMNATLKINSYGIDPAFLRFRITPQPRLLAARMRLRVILQHLLLAPQTPQQSNHLVLLQGQVLRPLQLHRHQHHHQLGQKKNKCHRELKLTIHQLQRQDSIKL